MPTDIKTYTEEELYTFLLGTFKDIYGDLVVLTGIKPSEVMTELEAALTHIAIAKTNSSVSQHNIDAAMGHLQRAALDAAKMLWITYRRRIDELLPDPTVRQFCINCPDDEFVRRFKAADQGAEEARHVELDNVGKDPGKSLTHYYQAISSIKEAYDSIDTEKAKQFRSFNIRHTIKQHGIAFFISFISGVLVTIITTFFIRS